MNMQLSMDLIWFLLGLIFLISEFIFPAFVLIFFGIGAWVTSLLVYLNISPNINIQLLVFPIVSLIVLILFRKKCHHLAHGKVSGRYEESPKNAMVGSFGTVIEDIEPHSHSGKVEVNGTNWTAVSDDIIPKGTGIEVIDCENLVLTVKKTQG